MSLLIKSLCILVILFSGSSFASGSEVNADELNELRKELNALSPASGGECINGYGSEAAMIKPKEILERARYQPEEDGYLVFDLPESYITDFGVRVNLKSEATIYQKGKKELELIHMVERNDSIYIRVITYVNMNSGRKCVETKFSVPLDVKKS